MRVSPLILALPALAVADQIPLVDQVMGWFNKATSVASSYASQVPNPSVPNPVRAGAAIVADGAVETLTLENWKEILKSGAATANPGIEEWMLYITGGNKTCFGLCEHADLEWNKSVALLSASRNAPHLARLDCETQPILCNSWALGAPTVVHILLPQPLPDQSLPATTVRSIDLNRTSVTAGEIAAIHTEEKYKDVAPYEGFWHPFDGPLAKAGLAIPLGYAIWGFSRIPSWAVMVAISFLSRTFMQVTSLERAS